MKKSFALAVVVLLVLGTVAHAVKPTPPSEIPAISDVENTESIVDSVVVGTWYEVLSVAGSGKFISARLYMYNTTGEFEFLIDGTQIFKYDIDAAISHLDKTHYSYIFMSASGTTKLVSIGFPFPIAFDESVVIRAKATWVLDAVSPWIQGNILWGK